MNKPVVFLKSHVDAFTRKDGVVVAAHDTKVQAAAAGTTVTHTSLKKHPMYSASDHQYFKDKGYEPHEIKGIWDRDHAAGHAPVEHEPAPDVVGVVGNPDFYKDKAAEKKAPVKRAAPKAAPAGGDERVKSDDAFDRLSQAGARHVASTSGGIGYKHSNTGEAVLPHRDEPDGHRTVSKKDLDEHLAKIKGGAPAAKDPHPNVIGHAENVKKHSFDFGGKKYHADGKTGKSMHDGTPVARYEHAETGHNVWKDDQHRVHADSLEEAKKARGGK